MAFQEFFLESFVRELIMNSAAPGTVRNKEFKDEHNRREFEKLRELFIIIGGGRLGVGQVFLETIEPLRITSEIGIKNIKKKIEDVKLIEDNQIKNSVVKKESSKDLIKKTERTLKVTEINRPTLQIQKNQIQKNDSFNENNSGIQSGSLNITPSLGRLEIIIADNSVQSVECEGIDRPIKIRKQGRVFVTQIRLSEEEIESVVEFFSKRARIPRIGGIFKAIVGGMVITAMDSGNEKRFIITKIFNQTLS